MALVACAFSSGTEKIGLASDHRVESAASSRKASQKTERELPAVLPLADCFACKEVRGTCA